MLAATCGLITAKSPVYGLITTWLLPASLVLLLLPVDIKAILRLGPTALAMFFIGAAGHHRRRRALLRPVQAADRPGVLVRLRRPFRLLDRRQRQHDRRQGGAVGAGCGLRADGDRRYGGAVPLDGDHDRHGRPAAGLRPLEPCRPRHPGPSRRAGGGASGDQRRPPDAGRYRARPGGGLRGGRRGPPDRPPAAADSGRGQHATPGRS